MCLTKVNAFNRKTSRIDEGLRDFNAFAQEEHHHYTKIH
jgi:hypothetical protein